MKPRPLTWWSTRRGETIELFGPGVVRCAFAYFTRIHAVVRGGSVDMREQIASAGRARPLAVHITEQPINGRLQFLGRLIGAARDSLLNSLNFCHTNIR